MRCRLVLMMMMMAMLPSCKKSPSSPAADSPSQPTGQSVNPIAQAADRAKSANNLKQIALAWQNHHDTTGFLPQDITGKNGKPLLSWRVAILPYIEQQNLYQQFKLDEPWDSDNNKKLLDMMPTTYVGPGGKADKSLTYYQSFAGPNAILNGKKMTLIQMTDGTSNIFMVAEAGEAVPWTKPADIAFDLKKPLPALGGLFGGGFNVAFADGEVRFVPKGVKEEALKRFITPNGGEIADMKDLSP